MSLKAYDNRELSWLKFNERVLHESMNDEVPVLERLNFLSIFTTNLDEFFSVRVGALSNRTALSSYFDNKTNLSAASQLELIRAEVIRLLALKDKFYFKLMKKLEAQNIRQVSTNNLKINDLIYLKAYFENEVLPLLSYQVIGKKNSCVFLEDKYTYLMVRIESASGVRFGFVKVSSYLDRIVFLKSDYLKYVLIEDLILYFADIIFKGFKCEEKALARVTRSADINTEEDYYYLRDYKESMLEIIRRRKLLPYVRLELSTSLEEGTIGELCDKLMLNKKQVYNFRSPFNLSYVNDLKDRLNDKSHLIYPYHRYNKTISLGMQSVINTVAGKDILLFYPFESIKPFIALLNNAAEDEDVTDIKITVYRVAKDSKIVSALIDASENGKNVTVMVELRARFDELNNIETVKLLQKAGCRVIYGLKNLKVHCKLLVIKKISNRKTAYITQIGTGNYNEKTSRMYTDLSLITADKSIAIEALEIFDALEKGAISLKCNDIIAAPVCLRKKILSLLDEEISYAKKGKDAYFFAKVNSLSDKVVIDKLIEASKAGVRVDLIVRGICCIIAGVPGLTENIKVTSIVGRFLEHSRIYSSGVEKRQQVFISSADLMARNMIKRVEVAVIIKDQEVKDKINRIISIYKNDNVNAWDMQSNGKYIKRKCCNEDILTDCHEIFKTYF